MATGDKRGVGPSPGGGPSIGATVGGKYRLTRLIGMGGMGTVYEAQDLKLGRAVAVKFLQQRVAHDFGLVERFMREAKATAAIAHPRIVDVFDVGWTDDGQLPYFVMELLDGKNLTSELRVSGPMSVDRAVGLVVQVLDALEAAHGRGFIHRDLKPENIFIIRHGLEEEVKLLDFGITKSIGGTDASLTNTGAVLGTPAYMSPEQARGSREIDLRTDVYAAGAILYELICGRPPYDGESYNEIIIKIATEDPPPIQSIRPGVHPALAAVIHKALARNAVDRWPSCAAMTRALHEVLDDVHTSTGIVTEMEPSLETTNSTLKPTPTAWEVTAPTPLPPTDPEDTLDPDERTNAIVTKLPSGSAVAAAIPRGVQIIDPEATESSILPAPDTTNPLHALDATEADAPEASSALAVWTTGNRVRTIAFLAAVGVLAGAGTYILGGWLLDEGPPSEPAHAVETFRLDPPPPPPPMPRIQGIEPIAPVEPQVPPVEPAPVSHEAAPTPTCRVRAVVLPSTATVSLDGSRAGSEIDLPSACGSTHVLEVTAAGHTPARVELRAAESGDPERVVLVRERHAGPRHPRGPGKLEPNPF